MPRTLREWKEWGQPTPEEVVRDARRTVRQETRTAPAEQDEYSPAELSEAATDFSKAIKDMLGIKPGDTIKDRYPLDAGSVTHNHLPYGNHRWVVSEAETDLPVRRVLEVRTGPFHDDATGKDYDPEVKITLLNGKDAQVIPSGRNAYREGLVILSDVMPVLPQVRA